MGGRKMKLLSLEVKKLYRCYNYEVNFNSDVTFLFGTNGCGKTTILNITEAIITGQLFKLFNYNFREIILKYAKRAEMENKEIISIILNKSILEISFNEQEYTLMMSDLEDISGPSKKNINEIARFFFSKYEFLEEMKRTFNYVYLPLNRSYVSLSENNDIYSYRYWRSIKDDDMDIGNTNYDPAMSKIENLIYRNYSKIISTVNKINDLFRNSILKSQIEINNTYNFDEYLSDIQKNSISSLKNTQKAYIKILKELNLINKSEEENYNKFFYDFIEEFSHVVNTETGISLNLLFKFQEISRIQKTIDIAEKMEQRKATVKKPIETFLNTMNSFINKDDDKKEICINNDGQVYFKTKYTDKISIHHLSSGEKQLITFFANLIFSVDSKSSGIFVVDEPELSLHLSWQKIFIDKVLEINSNIQLVFATHAPEIVGRRRNKMYRLEKKYTGDTK